MGLIYKFKGQWCYLYRAVDRSGNTVDFVLTKRAQEDECPVISN
ncbi:DDE-type integrase/transposase/recombinase [uncultured Flavobacterium sp.]